MPKNSWRLTPAEFSELQSGAIVSTESGILEIDAELRLMLRAILLNLSESKRLARFVMHNPTSRRVVRRFVAGETLDDAVAAVRIINQSGCPASFDCLGESVSTEAEARRAADVYNSILDRIAAERLDANASLKLTQLGLDVNPALCESLVSDIVV
ncbi:MAG TPA: hypothetical protein VGT03_02635, partial [Candidatus Acidoferrales bacterium]|nr:hypothetical protein [Candidatus Acidoferrales bacterium]